LAIHKVLSHVGPTALGWQICGAAAKAQPSFAP
jgi:hypothetical protein